MRIRFLSVEPLLEDLGSIDLSGIHWVIVGGESGFGARMMKREWVISVRRQCRKQDVPSSSNSGEAFGNRGMEGNLTVGLTMRCRLSRSFRKCSNRVTNS